jgi:putative Holliday junction resolvase
MNYLGLDIGRRKIGVAVGSSLIKQARPLGLIESQEQHLPSICAYVSQWQIDTIVIGDPGSREENQPLLTYIFELKEKLQSLCPSCQLVDWSEQGSSQEAKMLQKSSKNYQHSTDALAAMLILQGYFDFS